MITTLEKVTRIALKGGVSFLTAVCLLAFLSSHYLFAEESNQSKLPEAEQELNGSEAKPDISEVEREIDNLSAPPEAEKIGWIYDAISRVSGQERRELNKALESKMNDVFNNNIITQEIETKAQRDSEKNLQQEQSVIYEDIRKQIDDLKVGEKATIADLRMRDRIVAAISNITDPKPRYELLEYLDKKEKNNN
jgi:hypothetical protein